jgi:hypothetical protein
MVASVIGGPVTTLLDRSEEGHRTYSVIHRVKSTDLADGPSVVLDASGLPAVGSPWSFGNDNDSWAYCTGYAKVRKHSAVKEGDPTQHWTVEQKFSTIPTTRCQDESIENPLLEPQSISGSFVKYMKEATHDRNGDPIKTSSHELIRGAQVEFDGNRPTVQIGQNVVSLGLSTFSQMVDTVNDSTLWGLSTRMIKLSNVSWERNIYGTCTYYYTRTFEFDIDFTTFDRVVLDEGTKALGRLDPATGVWDSSTEFAPGVPLDLDNPLHFTRYKDKHGENSRVILNGSGVPITTIADAGSVDIEYYTESNFLSLGIPTSL